MNDSLFGTGGSGGATLTPPPSSALGPQQGPAVAPQEGAGVAETPPIKALLAGQPPAIWASTEEATPGTLFISENLPAFGQLGLGLYRGKDKVVLFNQELLPADQVKALDAAGQLDSLAAPIDSLLSPTPTTPATGSPDAAAGLSAPSASPPPSEVPASAPVAGIPPSTPKASGMRLDQLQPKAPSERPAPGQGMVINGLMRRAA